MSRTKIKLEVFQEIEFKIEDIAHAVSKLSSDDFGEFMEAVFEGLQTQCGNRAKYESQLSWIASQSPATFKGAVKDLAAFYQLDEEKGGGCDN